MAPLGHCSEWSANRIEDYAKVDNVQRDPNEPGPNIYGYRRFENVPAGKTYYYKVACHNDLGESPPSPAVKVITQ